MVTMEREQFFKACEPGGVVIALGALARNSFDPEKWPFHAAVALAGFVIIALPTFLPRKQKPDLH